MDITRICTKAFCVMQPLLTAIVFLVFIYVSTTTAGDCWGARMNNYNSCKTLLKKNVTKDWCCSKYSGEGISWTEESFSYSDIFKLTNLENGVPNCEACRGESGHDSCEEIDCGVDKKCVMKSGKPRCVCSPNCTKTADEPRGVVCATDFRKYKNKCAMLKEKCRSGSAIEMAYYGVCRESCVGVVCPEDQRCVEVQDGRPYCVSCHAPCPPTTENNYVCGNDSVTYESLCQLRQMACLQDQTVEGLHEGQCANLTSCDGLSCVEKNKCVMDDGVPRCVLCDFDCYGWRASSPVCASDDNTYGSWCDLREHICNTSQYLDIKGFGICEYGDLYELPEDTEGSTIDDNSILFQRLFGGYQAEDAALINSTMDSNSTDFYNTTEPPVQEVVLQADELASLLEDAGLEEQTLDPLEEQLIND